MLVVSKKNEIFPKSGEKIGHIPSRLKERVKEVDMKWLYRLIAEINHYLPDDWRLTRSTNNFFIRITGRHDFVLFGHSYRFEHTEEILHIVATILKPDHCDLDDLKHLGIQFSHKNKEKIQKDVPEAWRPNLYVFWPHPRDLGHPSPLWARQYEKIHPEKTIEFHRLHPLTKHGLDLDRHIWIRWHPNGQFEQVALPDKEFHGQDYWNIRSAKGIPEYQGNLKSYKQYFEERLHFWNAEFQIQPSRTYPTEREFKFAVLGSPANVIQLFKTIREETAFQSFRKQDEYQEKIEDIYLDTDELLAKSGVSFRLRRKKESIILTLKRRIFSQKGYFDRVEDDLVIAPDQAQALLRGEPLHLYPCRILEYLFPRHQSLKPVLKLENNRTVITVLDNKNRSIELCLDEVVYFDDPINPSPPIISTYEIELEQKTAPQETTQELARIIEERFAVLPVNQTKYQRGLSLIKTRSHPSTQKKVVIDTDCGVDDALALILALRSPELKVEAITTVSGNVDVHHVNKNVFRIFDALGLEKVPVVSQGAEAPLAHPCQNASSVHGDDGLGDVEDFKDCTPILDQRNAWTLLAELAQKYPNELTLITLGPLTNVAKAIQQFPDAIKQYKEIVAMGGVFFTAGNRSPDAEFNIFSDPEAAKVVVDFCRNTYLEGHSSPLPLTFAGLDVTHKVILPRSLIQRMEKTFQSRTLSFIKHISKKYMDFYRQNEGVNGCYLHDPLAVGYVINPAFFTVKQFHLEVESKGEFTVGMIVADDRPTRIFKQKDKEFTGVCAHIEAEPFLEFFLRRLLDENAESNYMASMRNKEISHV